MKTHLVFLGMFLLAVNFYPLKYYVSEFGIPCLIYWMSLICVNPHLQHTVQERVESDRRSKIYTLHYRSELHVLKWCTCMYSIFPMFTSHKRGIWSVFWEHRLRSMKSRKRWWDDVTCCDVTMSTGRRPRPVFIVSAIISGKERVGRALIAAPHLRVSQETHKTRAKKLWTVTQFWIERNYIIFIILILSMN